MRLLFSLSLIVLSIPKLSCLRCWVGHHSAPLSSMRLVDCARASEVRIRGLDLMFGDWSGGAHAQWACVKTPHLGTITKDCVLMENLPEWWERLCNGGVCYCNDKDGCNGAKTIVHKLSLFLTILYYLL